MALFKSESLFSLFIRLNYSFEAQAVIYSLTLVTELNTPNFAGPLRDCLYFCPGTFLLGPFQVGWEQLHRFQVGWERFHQIPFVWFIVQLHNETKRLEILLNRTREEINRDFVCFGYFTLSSSSSGSF